MGNNYVIVLAAGKGKRMGENINKQFIEIKNKPLLYYTLQAFSKNNLIDAIIIVCAENEIEYCRQEIINKYKIKKVKKIVAGGKERQDSVYNGLKALEKCDIVLIHDGARPFVSSKIIEDGIKYAKEFSACACGVKPKDTIKIKKQDNTSECTLNRENLFCVQTPQCFKYDLILQCHINLSRDKVNVTDDTAVVEYYGNEVYLYDGSYDNIKITTPEDKLIAESILKKFI